MTALWWVLGIVTYLGVGAVASTVFAKGKLGFDDLELGCLGLFWPLSVGVAGAVVLATGMGRCARKVAGR